MDAVGMLQMSSILLCKHRFHSRDETVSPLVSIIEQVGVEWCVSKSNQFQ